MSHEFAGFEIDVPFGPAAGAINGANVDLVRKQLIQVVNSPAGFAMMGSINKEGGLGNAHFGRVYYHNPSTGETGNSMDMPNIGLDAAYSLFPEMVRRAEDNGKPLGISVSAAAGEDPKEVLPELTYAMFEAGAHFVEANYSCPNKVTEDGGREPILSYDPDAVEEVREAIIAAIGTHQYFGEKWAPALLTSWSRRQAIERLASGLMTAAGVYYISLPNTVPGVILHDEQGGYALDVPGHQGGLSGPATQDLGRANLALICTKAPAELKKISCSGVNTGAEVYHRTHALGATLTAGVTVYFENEARGINYGQTGVQIAEQYIEAGENAA